MFVIVYPHAESFFSIHIIDHFTNEYLARDVQCTHSNPPTSQIIKLVCNIIRMNRSISALPYWVQNAHVASRENNIKLHIAMNAHLQILRFLWVQKHGSFPSIRPQTRLIILEYCNWSFSNVIIYIPFVRKRPLLNHMTRFITWQLECNLSSSHNDGLLLTLESPRS